MILLWTCSLLLPFVGVLWARSQDSSNIIVFERDQGTGPDLFWQMALGSSRGRVMISSMRYEALYFSPLSAEQPRLHWHTKTYSNRVTFDTPAGPWHGFELITNVTNGSMARGTEHTIWFPYWALAVPLAIPLVVAGYRRSRITTRHESRLCLSCGYDLRASKDRCPECGEPI
ncbi:MAG: hypothetical protein H7Z14_15845 [Anaerolineae bacterium]|nr:hypothetical protein [Phycisphaerae bacterium]